jgi:hypothetical protein
LIVYYITYKDYMEVGDKFTWILVIHTSDSMSKPF